MQMRSKPLGGIYMQSQGIIGKIPEKFNTTKTKHLDLTKCEVKRCEAIMQYNGQAISGKPLTNSI